MKQMRSILAPLLMLLTGVLMTSCDDEQETAMMLWGTWEGQLSTEFYQDRWGGYGQTYYTVGTLRENRDRATARAGR